MAQQAGRQADTVYLILSQHAWNSIRASLRSPRPHTATYRIGGGVSTTMLSRNIQEAEEVCRGRYRMFESERPLIRERWTHRLAKLQKEIEVMQRCLRVSARPLPPSLSLFSPSTLAHKPVDHYTYSLE